MKIFIRKLPAYLYILKSEADVNRGKPELDERMAGVSARKVAEWKKIVTQFIEMQEEIEKLYDGTVN